jgi:hypothetical protein
MMPWRCQCYVEEWSYGPVRWLWVCDLCGICFIIHMCVRCCLLFSMQPVLLLYVCELPVVHPWRLICVWVACCAACATVILLCVCATLMFVVVECCLVVVVECSLLCACKRGQNAIEIYIWMSCFFNFFFSNFWFLSGIPETEPNFPKPKPNFPNPK